MLIRPVRLTDIPALRRQQFEIVDVPDTLVRGFSPLTFSIRSAMMPLSGGTQTLLYTSRWRSFASCYSAARRNGEEARLIALGAAPCGESDLSLAWSTLIERTCLRAAGDGKLRVSARPEEGSEHAHILARLGFTLVTREQVLVWRPTSTSARPQLQPGLAPARGADAWDAWTLYSRTEPAPVQRADGLTSTSWRRGRKGRGGLEQEWVLRADGVAAAHLDVLYGSAGAAITVHFDPSYKEKLAATVDHALALCARRGSGTVYFTVREHQAPLLSLLLDRGFVPVRSQSRLVLYTSVLSYAREALRAATIEKSVPAVESGLTGVSGTMRATEGHSPDWYNL